MRTQRLMQSLMENVSEAQHDLLGALGSSYTAQMARCCEDEEKALLTFRSSLQKELGTAGSMRIYEAASAVHGNAMYTILQRRMTAAQQHAMQQPLAATKRAADQAAEGAPGGKRANHSRDNDDCPPPSADGSPEPKCASAASIQHAAEMYGQV